GQRIKVKGSKKNDGYYYIDSISNDGKKITLNSAEALQDEQSSDVNIIGICPDRIIRSSGSWSRDGFSSGDKIKVIGSSFNDGVYEIDSIKSSGKIMLLKTRDKLSYEEDDFLIITLLDNKKNITLNALVLIPEDGTTAESKSFGAGGELIGVKATESILENKATVKSYIKKDSQVIFSGELKIKSSLKSVNRAEADGYNGGILAVGANIAKCVSDTNIESYVEDNALIRGGNLTIEAYGEEDNFSDAISGSGAVISGAAAKGITENNTLTKVYLGGNIRAELINLNSEHKFIFNAKSDSSNASVLGVSGAWCEHSVNSEVYANIKENSQIESNQLIINAISRIEKPSLSETEYNTSSGSGGVVDAPASKSIAEISTVSQIDLGEKSSIKVEGEDVKFEVYAFNDIVAYDKAKLDSGGAICVAKASSIVDITKADSLINIGKNAFIQVDGDINLGTRIYAKVDTQADTKTYGASGAAQGESRSEITALNKIFIDRGAVLESKGTIYIFAGQSPDSNQDYFYMKARTDLWNKTVIPIKTKPIAHADLLQEDYIEIEENASILGGKDVVISTYKGSCTVDGYGEGKDFYRKIAEEIAEGLEKLFGGDGEVSLSIKGGSTRNYCLRGVTINGEVKAGLSHHQYLTIEKDGKVNIQGQDIEFSQTKESLVENIIKELKRYYKLKKEYAGTDQEYAFQAEIERLEEELKEIGQVEYNPSTGEYIIREDYEVDFITVDNIKA
ncbi:MAG: hypothetical protein DRP08_07160, partial [Candidatus Aenigmatarchaeota archaeon]